MAETSPVKLNPQAALKPQYFNDPAIDALYQMVLVLAEEVFTLREKLDAVVTLHDQGRTATTSELDALDTDAIFEARRQAFVERLLEPFDELLQREATMSQYTRGDGTGDSS